LRNDGRRIGREIEQRLAARHAGDQSVVAAHDGFELLRAGQRGEDDLVASATALGESAIRRRSAQIFSAAWRRASCTTISWPALRMFAEIPEPIVPGHESHPHCRFPSFSTDSDAEFGEDPPLQRFHALGIGLARLVIVPQQMKRANARRDGRRGRPQSCLGDFASRQTVWRASTTVDTGAGGRGAFTGRV